jgi:hypothetical protein
MYTCNPSIHVNPTLPLDEGRRQLLDINLQSVQVAEDVDLDDIAQRSKGYSGADLTNVCRDAAMMVGACHTSRCLSSWSSLVIISCHTGHALSCSNSANVRACSLISRVLLVMLMKHL